MHIYKFTSNLHSKTTPSSEPREAGPGNLLTPSADKETRNYDTRVLKPLSLAIKPKVKGIEP